MDDHEAFRNEFEALVKRVASLETMVSDLQHQLGTRVEALESKGVQTSTTDALFAGEAKIP